MKKEKETGFFGDLGDPNNPINILGDGEKISSKSDLGDTNNPINILEKGNGEKISSETKFCSNCGAKIDVKAEICPKCGVRVRAPKAKVKNPWLAMVLSLLIVGLGQIYNGQIGKGIMLWICCVISGVISTATWLTQTGSILLLILWIYGIFEAYCTAQMINAGEITV